MLRALFCAICHKHCAPYCEENKTRQGGLGIDRPAADGLEHRRRMHWLYFGFWINIGFRVIDCRWRFTEAAGN